MIADKTSAIKLTEKIGYGFGDMASSMFWKVFSYYLPFFFSNIYGLSLDQIALLLMVTRIWDAVSDPMMGIIADRTHTKWGKYRPYLLAMALPFSICGIALFTTPTLGPTAKLIYAYTSYILMMTVYTGINVPYGAMLGVISNDSKTRTVFSSFRMMFAYAGSFVVLLLWEPLCQALGGYDSPQGWQRAMATIAALSLILFLLCFRFTRERVSNEGNQSVGHDMRSLLRNAPWWILVAAVLCSNLFNTIRGCTTAYFFKDVIGPDVHMQIGSLEFLFYAGLFLSIGEVSNMIGVAIAPALSGAIGKKSTFIVSFLMAAAMSILFFYIPDSNAGYWMIMALQIGICIFTGIISPLVWSLYADVSDYARLRDGTASTGLIFSSSSMAQKFGSAFGGAFVMWMLAMFGYNTQADAAQSVQSIHGLKMMMSWIPGITAMLTAIIMAFYPLTTERMDRIRQSLTKL